MQESGETELGQEVGVQEEVNGHSQHWCGALPLVGELWCVEVT